MYECKCEGGYRKRSYNDDCSGIVVVVVVVVFVVFVFVVVVLVLL